MNRFVTAALITVGAVLLCSPSPHAESSTFAQTPAPRSPRIAVCSLVAEEEVKKHLPWRPLLIQVLPFSQGTIDAARKGGGLEAVSGIGEEAYFHNNRDR